MLSDLQRRIEAIMYAPNGGGDQRLLCGLLYGISQVYGAVQTMRRECYRRRWLRSFRLPCRVVSVGNLVVGGTGKTPMTAYLARTLEQMGHRVVVISRGYKGRGGKGDQVVSDGRQVLLDTRQSGDEAQLLARGLQPIPVLIAEDRYSAGMTAVKKFQPDVIVLDDGFQHIRLQRDLDLVLLDDAAPLGNGHLLPRGLLRETAAALRAADGFVFTRANLRPSNNGSHTGLAPPEKPVFYSTHKPHYRVLQNGRATRRPQTPAPASSGDLSKLKGARLAAFSGIARNDDFQRVLVENGANLVDVHAFCDHHPYCAGDLRWIAAQALRSNAGALVTTEKDFMRLPPDFDWPLDLMVMGVEIDFGDQESAFRDFLKLGLWH